MTVAFCLLEWFGPVVLVVVAIGSFVDASSTLLTVARVYRQVNALP